MSAADFVESERLRSDPERVLQVMVTGWERFAVRAPKDVMTAMDELRRDLTPLTSALAETPSCFLHGDWKASNLGTARDGRTVLIDWVYLGEGPACHDLGQYVEIAPGQDG